MKPCFSGCIQHPDYEFKSVFEVHALFEITVIIYNLSPKKLVQGLLATRTGGNWGKLNLSAKRACIHHDLSKDWKPSTIKWLVGLRNWRGSEDTICSAEPKAGPASVTIQVSGEQRSCETENTNYSGLLKWYPIETMFSLWVLAWSYKIVELKLCVTCKKNWWIWYYGVK